jgi:hypothetical protein
MAWTPTEKELQIIQDMTENRALEADIAKALGISHSLWSQRKKAIPEIQALILESRSKKIDYVKSKLWDIIENAEHRNHFSALCFYLTKYDTDIQETKADLPTGFSFKLIAPPKEEDAD